MFPGEGPLVGAAEQEQRFGEFDCSGVDVAQAVDEFVGVAVRVVAGHVEQRLRDRQRRTQLMGGVGGEPLLFGVVRFEPREHGVECVGEFAELVVAAVQLDPMGQRPVRRKARRMRDASQRREHVAGEEPTSDEAEHQQERHRGGGLRGEGALEIGAVGYGERRATGRREGDHLRYVSQQEHPHGREQQGAGNHQEPGIAEGEFEANAQTGRSIHDRLPCLRRPVLRRCGSRLRPRWR